MLNVWWYTLGSVIVISLLSLVGIIAFAFKVKKFKKYLIYVISFSAGAMFGDAFIHLLPEAVSTSGFTLTVSLSVLGGIAVFFLVEKVVHWRHCHMSGQDGHEHPFAIMNVFGDGVHNFIDGLVIGASYVASIPVGIATTLAIIFHEIPQEIADFGVLIHGGFTRIKALCLNFVTALAAVLGGILALALSAYSVNITNVLLPFAAGGFIYIAGADLIPELHKERKLSVSVGQFITFGLGILVMVLLLRVG
ncbi:ZIP family metal transporter [archaeon]|nr:ZIP family metal transporter [archaeon]